MRSLHLTNSWHSKSGGIATFYRALLEAANRERWELHIVVPGDSDSEEHVGTHGRIHYVQAPPAPFNPAYRMIFPNRFLFSGARIQQILQEVRPDVVEVCDKYTLNYLGAVLRLRLLKNVDFRPVVVGLSCERMDDNFRAYVGDHGPGRAFCSFYMKWIYFPFFDHHIAVSDYAAEELRPASKGHAVPRGIWVRPMGVDFGTLSPAHRNPEVRQRIERQAGAAPGGSLALYAGRLVPEKNLDLLLDTMEILAAHSPRDWRLLVAGDGVLCDHFARQAQRRLSGRVFLLGHIQDRRNLAELLANCDVFLHPNPREPFGIGPLEAMASGLPVVAPDRGGVTSYAGPENAWTVPPTAEAFARAADEAAGSLELREHRIAKALRTAEQYRWDRVAGSYLDLYRDIVRSSWEQARALQPDFMPKTASYPYAVRTTSKLVQSMFLAVSSMLRSPR